MIQGKAKSPISSNLLPAACPHVGGLVPSHSFVERQNWSGFRLELFGLHLPPATWPPTSCWSAWRGLWQSWPSSGQLAAGISLSWSSWWQGWRSRSFLTFLPGFLWAHTGNWATLSPFTPIFWRWENDDAQAQYSPATIDKQTARQTSNLMLVSHCYVIAP